MGLLVWCVGTHSLHIKVKVFKCLKQLQMYSKNTLSNIFHVLSPTKHQSLITETSKNKFA